MSETWTGRKPRTLDEDTIAEVRRRIGIPVVYSPRAHNEVSSTDSFRHFARAYGDGNPLYNDPAYAASTSWGTPIAPPLYPVVSGISRPVDLSPAEKALMKEGDPLAGIGQYMCGERWLFPKPIRAADVLWQSQALHSADLRSSSFGGGTRCPRVPSGGVGGRRRRPVRHPVPRLLARRTGEVAEGGQEPGYRAALVHRGGRRALDALYAAEMVRGPSPRTIADVQVGDDLGPDREGSDGGHRPGQLACRRRMGHVRRRDIEAGLRQPSAGAQVLREDPVGHLGLGAALPLGRRMGPAAWATRPHTTTGSCARTGWPTW